MTTNFALSLSFEGIELLHRQPKGWAIIGRADVGAANLDAQLAKLRQTAQALTPADLTTKLILPADQIKYLSIDGTQTTEDDVLAALDGTTPYALDALVIDYDRSGGRTHIAAVAKETLAEAEAFAHGHGFRPVYFAAIPPAFTFEKEVFFGPTEVMPQILGNAALVIGDAKPVTVVDLPDVPPAAPVARPSARPTLFDRIIPENLPKPAVAAPTAPVVTPAAVAVFTPRLLDPVIAETFARKPRRSLHASTPAARAAGQPRLVVTAQRAAPPAAQTGRPVKIAAAVAAGFALIGAIGWATLRSPDTPDSPAMPPIAEAAPAPAPAQQVTLVETAPVLPQLAPSLGPAPQIPGQADAPMLTAETAPLRSAPQVAAPLVAPDPRPDQAIARPAQAQSAGNPAAARVLSPDEAAAAYAATGVWQRAPRFVDQPQGRAIDGLIIPFSEAAVTRPPLPASVSVVPQDPSFLEPAAPPPAGVTFVLDDNGFVRATPEGAVTPQGAIVFAGAPDVTTRLRPELSDEDRARLAGTASTPEAEVADDAPAVTADGVVVIAGRPDVVPPVRPADAELAATSDALSAGGVALSGLSADGASGASLLQSGDPAVRPAPRPSALASTAQPADPGTPDITAIIAGIAADGVAAASPLAVQQSTRPSLRPRNFDQVVAAAIARQALRAAPAPTPAPAAPSVQTAAPVAPQNFSPVPGGVARAATQEDAIRLRQVNLIGVYGRPNDRRALVRLSNGRYVRVEVGSSLDGGQVTAISETALNYVKRGRTYALELPDS